MAIKARFVIVGNGGSRQPNYYEDLEAAIAAAETLNSGVSVPERDGYTVNPVFIGDWDESY